MSRVKRPPGLLAWRPSAIYCLGAMHSPTVLVCGPGASIYGVSQFLSVHPARGSGVLGLCFRYPQTRKIILAFYLVMRYNIHVGFAGVMELVDVVDSKSTAGDSVPVRVRSPAPEIDRFRQEACRFLFCKNFHDCCT